MKGSVMSAWKISIYFIVGFVVAGIGLVYLFDVLIELGVAHHGNMTGMNAELALSLSIAFGLILSYNSIIRITLDSVSWPFLFLFRRSVSTKQIAQLQIEDNSQLVKVEATSSNPHGSYEMSKDITVEFIGEFGSRVLSFSSLSNARRFVNFIKHANSKN